MADEFYIDLSDAAIAGMEDYFGHIAEAGALIVRDNVVLQMVDGPPRSGQFYKVPGTQTLYRASAPGEAPAEREGHYAASWKVDPATRRGELIEAAAFTDEMVGPHVLGELLEHGTEDMQPRPHVAPGIEAALPELNALIDEFNAAARNRA